MTAEAQASDKVLPSVPRTCLERLSVAPKRYLGGRMNQHWLVETSNCQLVLRGYAMEQCKSAEYELEVLRRLHDQGWPVPELVEAPILEEGRLWCLFTLLPGVSRPENCPEDRRARGRILAKLHEATATLADMGQRSGFHKADEVSRDPGLLEAIRNYERIRPDIAHVMRWHLDKALQMFDQIVLDDMETIVLHSDFAPWNLLFEGGKLSGILDFESTHLNYRVSDFALSWRGYQHEVIEGYEEIHNLSDRDHHLLVPAFWSWLFLGVKEAVGRMVSGSDRTHGFDWAIKQLLKRSSQHHIEPYPGLQSRF
jgi:aminoglycoside phosphotransferase (APT) family kinase protein